MFQIATYETYQDGQVIFAEGTHGDWIYIVDEGEVEISKSLKGHKIVIASMKVGDIFGEVAYITKDDRTATATAVGTTTVGIIDRDFFDREFNKLSASFQMVLRTMAQRLRKTTEVAVQLQENLLEP